MCDKVTGIFLNEPIGLLIKPAGRQLVLSLKPPFEGSTMTS